ncbi:hypothetical protein RIF29_18906 [Crotalaria pallida]|uniref:PB1-like domain-containing protein n=1 Tax=Crotalaria pallida TaxID=3830 RepID=A0AAN9EYJ0_CROPI
MHYNLVIHHGGELKKFPSISYHGGFTTKYPEYSEDKISYSGLVSLWSDYGYPNNSYMIGVLPGGNLNHGCLPLNDDHDVLYFLGKQKSCSSVDFVVYIFTSEDQSKEDEHEAEGDCEDEGWEATLGKYAKILNSHIEGPYDEDIFDSFRNENVHDQASGEEFTKEQEPIFEFGNEEFDQNEWNEPPSVGEEFESPCGSDDDSQMLKWPQVNDETDMVNPRLEKGMEFKNATAFRAALKEYCKRHKGNELRDAMWACAFATTPAQFKTRIDDKANTMAKKKEQETVNSDVVHVLTPSPATWYQSSQGASRIVGKDKGEKHWIV